MIVSRAYAAGTVLNALATFKGSAFALSLETTVKVWVEEGKGGVEVYLSGVRIRSGVAERVFRMFNACGRVEIESSIPRGSGLGSSSAFVNALLCSMMKWRGEELKASRILSTNARLSIEAGISYTGAFDDAAASLLGGFVVSDNSRMKLYRWDKKGGRALILIPEFDRGKVEWRRIREEGKMLENLFPKLLEGKYCDVMVENTRFYCRMIGYPVEIAEKARKIGACCGLSGNGPCFVALSDSGEVLKEVEEIWSEYGKTVKAFIPEKPAEKVVIDEELFLRM